ncbi:Type III pantothenate kinase [Stieleria maiorica]|uniref:Type III pantothenate kinase n=1 Tax=Stieleria maiorica TaxID=2795974 RepID=A0A5B9M767_9BACT|nr:type III pantothenate kinase [Stieleria maiorica]QEF96513.1 Type III pantothenate kinase [Stieleria maiorica]
MTPRETIAAIDVGNSAIKVALAKVSELITAAGDLSAGDAPVRYQSFPLDQPRWDQQICRWVRQHAGQATVSWWVSTVNHAASRPLKDAVLGVADSAAESAPDRQQAWHNLTFEDVPLRIKVDAPEKVGIDRLLSAYAASTRFAAPLVVVDAGSAVTVDCVRPDSDARPVFVGGAILPGIRLQHAALATGTEGLQQATQRIDPAEVAAMMPATNTQQAIRLGVLAAVVGGVERLAQEYACPDDDAVESLPIVLCGGDAATLSPYLRALHQQVPHLVCLGILDLAIQQCQIAPSGLK